MREQACRRPQTPTRRTTLRRSISADHFAQCAEYAAIKAIAEKWHLWIIEDGAQSIGARDGDQMAGTFGFFRGYEVLSLSGGGEQLFNIDAGVIESDRQEYEVQMSVRMPGMGRKSAIAELEPNMTVRQEITMQLLK